MIEKRYDDDETPLTTHFLHHITDGDAHPGETTLAITYTTAVLIVLTLALWAARCLW